MISEVHKALYSFWIGFGIPVYIQGQVPVNQDGSISATYPYITIQASSGDPLSTDVLTAFCWHHKNKNSYWWSCNSANAERAKLLDKISDAIPASGKLLTLDSGGLIVLYRYAGFEQYYDDPTDRDVIGSRVSYTIKYLTL